MGSLNLIFGELGYIPASAEMDYKSILIGVFSQLYFQYFIYSLLLSKKNSQRLAIIQVIPIAVLIVAKWVGDYMGIFSQFTTLSYKTDIIENPLFIIRSTIISIQLLYAVVIILFANRLIPIYQDYIDSTESNSARNIIWIKEICYLFLSLSAVYTIEVIFNNLTTALIYFAVAIYSFSRAIILMLNNYVDSFNINGDLYDRIGIRWSIRKLWYIPQERVNLYQNRSIEKTLFEAIESWIIDSKAYANNNFSFKDIADVFPQLNYKTYNELLLRCCGSTFQAYIRGIRIDQATKLIADKTQDLRLKTIADEVGFENSSAFSRAFKATKGVPPSQWRTNLKEF